MTLKVFDLACENEHVFEGWFASQTSYEDQLSRGLVRCPVCQSARISRRVSAPHLNISHLREPAALNQPSAPHGRAAVAAPSSSQLAQLQAQVMRQVRQMVHQSEDVGTAFAQEARRMSLGEVEERSIRGTVSVQEGQELVDEGISFMLIPGILDDDRLQ